MEMALNFLFHILVIYLCVFFGKTSIQINSLFLNQVITWVFYCFFKVLICRSLLHILGFAWWLSGQNVCQQWKRHRRCMFHPWMGKVPWRREWQPTQVFLLKNPMDRVTWWATVQRVAESQIYIYILGINPLSNKWLGNIYQWNHLFLSFSLLDVFDCQLYLFHLPGGYFLLSLTVSFASPKSIWFKVFLFLIQL